MNVDYVDMIREIATITLRGSDSERQKVIGDSGDVESDDVRRAAFYDAISGDELREDLVRIGRIVEMETFEKHGLCEKRPLK